MAWSYRSDRADEVYTEGGGPAIITGEQAPETPGGMSVEDKKLREKKKPVEGVFTQFQERPGQNVPRVIEGEGETAKDKEIVKATKADEKDKDKFDLTKQEMLDRERTRIRAEEQMKSDADELEKDENT
jgi:hypothetical protein